MFRWLSRLIAGRALAPSSAERSRSGRWPSVRRAHLLREPYCQFCGSYDNLHVHHIVPVSVNPAGELDLSNLMTLCPTCHYVFGHLFDWSLYNDEIRADVNHWRHKRRMAAERHAKTFTARGV